MSCDNNSLHTKTICQALNHSYYTVMDLHSIIRTYDWSDGMPMQ